MDKAELRRLVLGIRRAIDAETRRRAGESLARSFSPNHPILAAARVVAGYLALPDELPPEPLMTRLHEEGRIVASPFWDAESRMYRFRRWRPDAVLGEGPMHVLEPLQGEIVEDRDIDAVLVPGIAFDRHGHRLGFGGGWYDRMLVRCRPDALFCAIAFKEQIVPEVPAEPHDIRVHWIATPSGPVPCPR